MTKTIEVQEADANLQELLSLVREGTEVILMKGDMPLARLAPMKNTESAEKPRVLGLHAHLGTAWMSEDFDAPMPDEFWLDEE